MDITPLMAAVVDGHLAVAELLLDKGANIHRSGRIGANPIAVAALHNNMPMVQSFFKRGATVKEAESGLFASAMNGHTAMVKFLLDNGVKVDSMGDPRFNFIKATKASRRYNRLSLTLTEGTKKTGLSIQNPGW